jgi:hypothetical protein
MHATEAVETSEALLHDKGQLLKTITIPLTDGTTQTVHIRRASPGNMAMMMEVAQAKGDLDEKYEPICAAAKYRLMARNVILRVHGPDDEPLFSENEVDKVARAPWLHSVYEECLAAELAANYRLEVLTQALSISVVLLTRVRRFQRLWSGRQ